MFVSLVCAGNLSWGFLSGKSRCHKIFAIKWGLECWHSWESTGQSNKSIHKSIFKLLSLLSKVDWKSSSFLDLTLTFPSRGHFYSRAHVVKIINELTSLKSKKIIVCSNTGTGPERRRGVRLGKMLQVIACPQFGKIPF